MLEDILRQVKALMQNQLPVKLDQIELERADGVILEDMQSFTIQAGGSGFAGHQGRHTTGHHDGRQKYPGVTIRGEDTTATNALSRRRELRHKVSVWITDMEVSPDSELAQTKLLRYAEAIERVLTLDPSLGGKAVDSTVTSHVYHQREGEFIGRAILMMEVLERPSTSNY